MLRRGSIVSREAAQFSTFLLNKSFRWLLLTCMCFLLVLYANRTSNDELNILRANFQEREVAAIQMPIKTKEDLERVSGGKKVILLWNAFFGEKDYGVGGFGTTAFERSQCSEICWTTDDQGVLEWADAVLVHVFNMGPQFQNVSMPKRYNQKQIFVFFILESPLRSYRGFVDLDYSFKDIFNLTFSFLDSPDTDIYIPMGGVKKRDEPAKGKLPLLNSLREKKLIAWFISNCNAPSARLDYANELARHIPVHIFGKCGNGTHVCPPGEIECYSRVIQSYMFYLAFENSFCDGYATEKLFRTMTTHMVPIVYGKANYSSILPPNSYIDVRDFASPRHLGRYIAGLQKFPRKYMKLVEWKNEYSVLQEGDFKAAGFCRLCEILNTENYPYKSNYDPVEDYWNPDKICLIGNKEREVVGLPNIID